METTTKATILQIIPAPGWYAVYVINAYTPKPFLFFSPLATWALQEVVETNEFDEVIDKYTDTIGQTADEFVLSAERNLKHFVFYCHENDKDIDFSDLLAEYVQD